MNTYTPAMLAHWLRDVVTSYHPGSITPRCTGGIKLLSGKENGPLRPECLYLCEPAALSAALAQGHLPPEGLFAITSEGEAGSGPIPEGLSLIRTRLPLLELYNQVQEHVHRFLAWDADLQRVIYTNAGLQELLQQAAREIDATILLINVGFKLVASVLSPHVHEPMAEELEENGFQSFDTIQAIRRQIPIRQGANGEFVEFVSTTSHNYSIIRVIRFRDTLAARLCVVLNSPEPDPCCFDLTAILARYVEEYMFSDQGMDYAGNTAFGSLAADLIECRLTDPEELEQRLKVIKLAVRRYYHLMLVSFNTGQDRSVIPWNYVIDQLEHIFPYSNITTYHGDILAIIRKTQRGSRPSFDRDAMLRLLEQYNAYAVIGNASEYLTSMPPVYHQAKDALRLGQTMDPERRILFYEDYGIYQIIELAGESARQRLGSRNLVHLCNNEIISLLLYDKKSGSNLVDVLHAYLLHERNASETAKALYIHRNTMLYKIRKIEEIIGCTLDDPMLRERLMFSYRVLEYITRCCKEDILTLKRIRSEDRLPTHVP